MTTYDPGDIVLMPLTSQPQNDRFLALSRWNEAGLPKPTWIKPVIGTLAVSLLVRVIGNLADEDVTPVRQALSRILDQRWS
jgi:hypothetical protein